MFYLFSRDVVISKTQLYYIKHDYHTRATNTIIYSLSYTYAESGAMTFAITLSDDYCRLVPLAMKLSLQ